ncbi:hypothetical protein FIE12Z_11951, partial [Fusarium flagelliforme]
MDDQNKNQKKPEAKPEAPGVPRPLSSRLRPSYFDIPPIDDRFSMRPASWITPSLVPPSGKPYNYFSLEETSREHTPVHDTPSTPSASKLPPLNPSSRKRKYDSISTSSPPPSPEASRAAPPKHSKNPLTPAKPKKSKPMSVREEEERIAQLRGLRDLYRPEYLISLQEQEKKRSPSLISTDESDDDYIASDTESETESESSRERETNCSPVPSCTDESDSDYSVPDTESIPDTSSEPEPEPSQEQVRDISPSVSEKMLRTMSTPEPDLYSPPIPSWNDLGPRDDDKLYGALVGLVPASSLGPPPPSPQNTATPPQEQEKNRSPGPIDNDSLSTLSQAIEKELEKQQREDQALGSAKPSLSQDLEKKMLTSLSAYDLNIEKLGQEIRDRCDRICERFDRLEKQKRDRRDNAIPRTYQEMAEIMFPGRSICDLTVDERQMVRVERRRRLEKGHLERFGNRGKAIAGPSREREQMVSPSPNLDVMIRQEREKIRELNRARRAAAAAWRPFSEPRTRLPSPEHNDPVSQTPETSEQQSRKGIDAPVATPQKKEKKTRVYDDDLSEMIDQQRRSEERKKKRSPRPNPNDALDMPEKEAREGTDTTISKPSQDEKKDALPDYDWVMELEKNLRESLDSFPPRPSSSQGQKRKRSTASDHEKSFFEHFEEMRKHVRESVEQEKKRRKTNDLSFQECMNDLYPADSEIWKIDDEPLQVKSSKPVESQSDKDLGNDRPLSFDEYLAQDLEGAINDLKSSAPFADNPALLTMPTVSTTSPMPPMAP